MKTSKAQVVPFLMLLCVLSFGSGEAAAARAQGPMQVSGQTLPGQVYSQSDSGGQMPASARNNLLSGLMYDEWKSLPAPYNRSVAELNDMLSYDTPGLTGALAHKIWEQESAPFSRSIYELNALKQQYLKAAGMP